LPFDRKDENIAVAKMGLFDRFFQGIGRRATGPWRAPGLGGPGDRWKFVNRYRNRCSVSLTPASAASLLTLTVEFLARLALLAQPLGLI
jgi:hypothetical protein